MRKQVGLLIAISVSLGSPGAWANSCTPTAIHSARADFQAVETHAILNLDPLPPGVSEAPAHSGPPFKTQPKLNEYLDEEKPVGTPGGKDVKYWTQGQAEFRRLRLGSDGRIYDLNGKLFDTRAGVQLYRDGSVYRQGGRAIFVMDAYGNIWASNVQIVGVIHHTSFLRGGEIAAAGEIQVENGVLKLVADKSGHYFPTRDKAYQFEARLKEAWGSKFDPSQVGFEAYSPDPNLPPPSVRSDERPPGW
jgi:hypothetical protein